MNKSLDTLTAKDIMSPEVLMAYEGWSIKRLADFFVKYNISGAPVIASDHELVGVVTVSDILKFNSLPKEDKATLVSENIYVEYVGQTFDPEYVQDLAQNAEKNCTVNRIMTPEVVSVDCNTLLPDVAKLMHQRKIHRVFVTQNSLICGVVSTGNILEKIAGMA